MRVWAIFKLEKDRKTRHISISDITSPGSTTEPRTAGHHRRNYPYGCQAAENFSISTHHVLGWIAIWPRNRSKRLKERISRLVWVGIAPWVLHDSRISNCRHRQHNHRRSYGHRTTEVCRCLIWPLVAADCVSVTTDMPTGSVWSRNRRGLQVFHLVIGNGRLWSPTYLQDPCDQGVAKDCRCMMWPWQGQTFWNWVPVITEPLVTGHCSDLN